MRQEVLEHKSKENDVLTKICDNFIAKMETSTLRVINCSTGPSQMSRSMLILCMWASGHIRIFLNKLSKSISVLLLFFCLFKLTLSRSNEF